MRLTRRQSILLAVLGAPAGLLAALGVRHQTPFENTLSPEELRGLKVLKPREYATLKAAIARIARGDSPAWPRPETIAAAPFAEAYLAGLATQELQDFRQLLSVLEHVLPLGEGQTLPFTALTAERQDAVLQHLERHPSALLRAGFAALKQCTALAYFRHPSTFPLLGYEGPKVPARGEDGLRPVRSPLLPRARETHFDVDVVVVGSGAGGSMACKELATAGLSVLLLEMGKDHPPQSLTQREDEMIPELYQDGGGRATLDRAITVLQGKGLGGSTMHNQNLCKRAPDAVLEAWVRGGATGWGPAEMGPLYAEVEEELHVTPIAEADITPNNDVLRRGAKALGWQNGLLSHNRDGCTRSGFCELGCAYNGKNNARKVLLPAAVLAGARIRTETHVERLLFEAGRVTGLLARDFRTGEEISVRARAVVLAGSAVGSAALAIASGVPDPFAQQGQGLRLHPGAAVAGVFREEIRGWQGIPQAWECTEWLRFGPESERRVWLVPAFAHPVGTASMLPGVGPAWTGSMRKYPHLAVLTAMLHDETAGQVRVKNQRPALRYELSDADRAQLAQGLRACTELLLAAGAEEVLLPFAPPLAIRRLRELDGKLTPAALGPLRLPLTAVHPMGAMRMGSDPRTSVCMPSGEHHQLKGLWVADGGLFPTSIGGPPQLSIYTVGKRVGRAVAASLRHG